MSVSHSTKDERSVAVSPGARGVWKRPVLVKIDAARETAAGKSSNMAQGNGMNGPTS
jgi:hypothetical protein